jgi:hypothetical protein
VAERKTDEDVVDRVLEHAWDAVVVLRCDHEEGVGVGDLPVPGLDDRLGIWDVDEVTEGSQVFLKDWERPLAEIDELDVEGAVTLGAIDDPGDDMVGGA